MKNKDNSLNLVRYIKNLLQSKKSSKNSNRPEKHQPRWLYRNE